MLRLLIGFAFGLALAGAMARGPCQMADTPYHIEQMPGMLVPCPAGENP